VLNCLTTKDSYGRDYQISKHSIIASNVYVEALNVHAICLPIICAVGALVYPQLHVHLFKDLFKKYQTPPLLFTISAGERTFSCLLHGVGLFCCAIKCYRFDVYHLL
jgi:hypothetical protein